LNLSTLNRNIAYNVLGQVVLIGLALVAVRFIFRQLGPDAFGVILFGQTLGAILLGAFDLGIASIVVREVAGRAADDPPYLRQLLQTASLFYWVVYVVLAAATIILAPVFAQRWINLTSMDSRTATQMIQVLGAGTLLILPRSLYAAFFRGRQRIGLANVIDVSTLAVQQAGLIAIVAGHGGPVAAVAWIAASYALSVAVYAIVFGRAAGFGALLPRYWRGVVERNRRFSMHMMSISTLGMVQMQADKVILSKLLPVPALGFYGLASTVVASGGRLASAVAEAALPSFADRFHRDDHPGLLVEYRRVHGLISYLAAPGFAAIVFLTVPLFSYVFNPVVAEQLRLPVALLSTGWYLNATLLVPYMMSLAAGKPEITARQNALALVIVLPLTVGAIYAFGLAGAALSWVIYHLFAYAYGLPRICTECLHFPVRTWLKEIAAFLALIGLAYGAGYFAAAWLGGTMLPLGIGYLGASCLYLFVGQRLLRSANQHSRLLERAA